MGSAACFFAARVEEELSMIGVLVCGAVALAIFALVALADERWPDRLSRRGHQLRGEAWRGEYGARAAYSAVTRRTRGA
jgi:hypothetical protein